MENVDAALESLESQSDELFDEVKLMLEEVRQDKAELKNVKAETDADDAGTSQKETNSQDKSQPNGLPSEQCNSVDPKLKQNAEVSSSPFNKDDKISWVLWRVYSSNIFGDIDRK